MVSFFTGEVMARRIRRFSMDIFLALVRTWGRILGFALSFFGIGTLFTGCPMYAPVFMYGPPPTRRISGTVLHSITPIPNILIHVVNATGSQISGDVRTAPDGTYTVTFGDPGNVTVTVHAEDTDDIANFGAFASQTSDVPLTSAANDYTVNFTMGS
jgi:hypothetical protein